MFSFYIVNRKRAKRERCVCVCVRVKGVGGATTMEKCTCSKVKYDRCDYRGNTPASLSCTAPQYTFQKHSTHACFTCKVYTHARSLPQEGEGIAPQSSRRGMWCRPLNFPLTHTHTGTLPVFSFFSLSVYDPETINPPPTLQSALSDKSWSSCTD